MSRQCPEPRDRGRDFAALYMAKTTGFVRNWWFSFTFWPQGSRVRLRRGCTGTFQESLPAEPHLFAEPFTEHLAFPWIFIYDVKWWVVSIRPRLGNIRKEEVNGMACDETLYRQYIDGDDEGLDALMKKYGDPLTLYIDGYLHDVHEAEELMLDVFAYLFTRKPPIRDGGFKTYLYKAARHMALRRKSKRRRLFSLDELAEEPDGRLLAEEVIRTKERDRILHFCMAEMNPDYREVLYLTYFEDMSYAQAAEVMGTTVKQITNLVYRGKESLRRLLEREGVTNAES